MTAPPWWKRLPSRLLWEDGELAKLKAESPEIMAGHRWVRDGAGGEPHLRATILIAEKPFQLKITFPPHYPEGCPTAYPVPYDRPTSSHQFVRSGAFCLEFGPDNWHPRHSAAELVLSAWRLIALETINKFEPIRIPSRHEPSLHESARGGDILLLRTAELNERIRAASGSGAFSCRIVKPSMNRLVPVEFPTGEALPYIPPSLAKGSAVTGQFVCLREDAPTETPSERGLFNNFVKEFGGATLPPSETAIVMLRWTTGKATAYLCDDKDASALVDFPLHSDGATRTPPQMTIALAARRFGIVGLGSLGAKVAVSLARSGANRFVLVDDDVFQADNVCRHVAGYGDVGIMKPNVVGEQIRGVLATDAEIQTFTIGLGSATNPSLHASAVETLGNCDFLIDATCNPDVFGIMAMIASDNRKPLAWAEVFGAGLGGMIAIARPDVSPCPRCVRAGLLAELANWPPAPNRTTTVRYGGEDEALVASDADVTFIAAALTKRIMDAVSGAWDEDSEAIVLGLRPCWVFDAPFQSRRVRVRPDDFSCHRCWTREDAATDESAEQAEKLFSNDDNADHPSTA